MKIALLVAALAVQAATPAQAPPSEAPADQQRSTPNAFHGGKGCTPIVVQVAGEDRDYRGTRLDQQPPAQLLYAVDRQVAGCREVTFVNGRRVGSAEPSRR